jgi:hypothetical protein
MRVSLAPLEEDTKCSMLLVRGNQSGCLQDALDYARIDIMSFPSTRKVSALADLLSNHDA